jgi:hypothetical protein
MTVLIFHVVPSVSKRRCFNFSKQAGQAARAAEPQRVKARNPNVFVECSSLVERHRIRQTPAGWIYQSLWTDALDHRQLRLATQNLSSER